MIDAPVRSLFGHLKCNRKRLQRCFKGSIIRYKTKEMHFQCCELLYFVVDECQSNPCENGGTCIDELGSYQCSCNRGYSGNNCQGYQLMKC